MSGHHRSQLLPPLCRCLQAAEASPEEGGLGSRYAFRQRFYSTLPPTLDNELWVRLCMYARRVICCECAGNGWWLVGATSLSRRTVRAGVLHTHRHCSCFLCCTGRPPRVNCIQSLPLSDHPQVNLGLGMPQDAIVSDRAFNTRETTNAFLGYAAVEAVEYDPRCGLPASCFTHQPGWLIWLVCGLMHLLRVLSLCRLAPLLHRSVGLRTQPVCRPLTATPPHSAAHRDAPLRETVTLSRLAPDMAPLPPRRLELYINHLSSEEGPGGSFLTSELCRQVCLVWGEGIGAYACDGLLRMPHVANLGTTCLVKYACG